MDVVESAVSRNDVDSADCGLCGGQTSILQRYGDYQIRRCAVCDFGFTWPPMPPEAHLDFHGPQFFERYYRNSIDSLYQREGSLYRRERAKKLWNLETFSRCVPRGRLLDVGTGQGLFAYLARDRGYQVGVVEICPPTADFHRRQGLEVHQGYLEDAGFPDATYDGVTMWHTLEHMFDPMETLREVTRILKPGACLVGAIPNWKGLGTRLRLLLRHPLFDPATDHELHFSYFSPRSLHRALRGAGLVPVKIGVEWHRPRRMRDRIVHSAGQLLSVLLGQNLRETMLFIARKPEPTGLPAREFVEHRNDSVGNRPIHISRPILTKNGEPAVSVIIPTRDGERGGYLPALLDQLRGQTLERFEVLLVQGDSRQGRAINCAAAEAQGEVLVTLDDDTRLGSPDTLQKLVEGLSSDPRIGMAGGSNRPTPDEGRLVRQVMEQVPRRSSPEVPNLVDSDLAEHPCLAMRRAVFFQVGGENEWMPRGLDPYLRTRFRQAGYRVVVVPGVVYHHLPPRDLYALARQFFRNGAQSRFCSRRFPQWCYDTSEAHEDRPPRVSSLLSRGWRFVRDLASAVAKGRTVYLFTRVSYAAGWLWEESRARLGLDVEQE